MTNGRLGRNTRILHSLKRPYIISSVEDRLGDILRRGRVEKGSEKLIHCILLSMNYLPCIAEGIEVVYSDEVFVTVKVVNIVEDVDAVEVVEAFKMVGIVDVEDI